MPLGCSFWCHGVALGMGTTLLLGALAFWASLASGGLLRVLAAALLLAWPLVVAVQLWAGVGVWRAAGAQARHGGDAGPALAARAAVALGLLASGAAGVLLYGPQLGSRLQLAQGQEPLGTPTLRLSDDGRRLHLQGPLALGTVARLQAVVADPAAVRLLDLQSTQGRWAEAQALATLVRRHGWAVRASGPCENHCTQVLLAGSQRLLTPQARLGLNSPHPGTVNPLWVWAGRAYAASAWRQAGWPEPVVQRRLATPPWRMWFPSDAELRATGLLALPSRSLDVDLPQGPRPTLGDLVDALAVHPVWAAMAVRDPALLADGAQRLLAAWPAAASAAGAEAAVPGQALQLQAQQVLAERVPVLLFNAGPELRARYAQLLAAQLQGVQSQGAQACAAVLQGDVAIRQTLPVPLREQEADWLVNAATEPPRQTPARPPGALEAEVLRRNLGPSAPVRLLQLWRPEGAAASAPDCAAAQALLGEVMALPPAEQKLATRLVFEKR